MRRYIDVPVFLAANVVVDIEPLLVILFSFDYPFHGYCHTLFIGGLIGIFFGCAAYPFRALIRTGMSEIHLRYSTTLPKMAISGMLGVWLHILFDAVMHSDTTPFYPLSPVNPLFGIISASNLETVCTLFFLPAVGLYYLARRKKNTGPALTRNRRREK